MIPYNVASFSINLVTPCISKNLNMFLFLVSSDSKLDALKDPIKVKTNETDNCKGYITEDTKDGKHYVDNSLRRWPDNEIPYTIDSTFNDEQVLVILGSMAAIEISSCVHFRPATADDSDYVRIKHDEDGCFAHLGYYPGFGEHKCNLDLSGCVFHSVVVHELLHNTGFSHEHQRLDRDNFVDIHWENLESDAFSQFYKRGTTGLDCNTECTPADTSGCGTCTRGEDHTTFGLPYDPDSIMHYDNDAFSKNGGDTITWDLDNTRQLSTDVMTALDIQKLNMAYSCPALPCGGFFTGLDTDTGIIDGTTCDMACQWFIKAPRGHIIILEVLDFSFGSSSGDVTISDFFAERTLDTLSSTSNPVGNAYLVKGTEARILLDRQSNSNTFIMKWTIMEARDICCRTVSIDSPDSSFDNAHEGSYQWAGTYTWTFGSKSS